MRIDETRHAGVVGAGPPRLERLHRPAAVPDQDQCAGDHAERAGSGRHQRPDRQGEAGPGCVQVPRPEHVGPHGAVDRLADWRGERERGDEDRGLGDPRQRPRDRLPRASRADQHSPERASAGKRDAGDDQTCERDPGDLPDGHVRVAERPLLHGQPRRMEVEREEDVDEGDRHGLGVRHVAGNPRHVGNGGADIGEDRPDPGARVGPQEPQELGREREGRRVMAVQGQAGEPAVHHPPAPSAPAQRGEHRQRRAGQESDHQRVRSRLGRVVDHHRAQRHGRGCHESRCPTHELPPDGVDQRDRHRPRDQRGEPQPLVARADLRRQPGEDERQRWGDLGVAVDDAEHAPEAAALDDPGRRELVAK